MKFNTSAKSIYEVFSNENPKYVRLAIEAFDKDSRTVAILQKRYGVNYDGEGGVRFLGYADEEFLNCALRRIESYVPAIKVLAEVYKETDTQILNRFRKQNDVQILNMIRNLSKNNPKSVSSLLTSKNMILTTYKVSEDLLVAALEHVTNLDSRRMYMYYYGIARNKMNMETLLKVFPSYNEAKVKKVLLEVQEQLPEYIKIEKEKEKLNGEEPLPKRKYTKASVAKNTEHKSGFRYNSLFDYFFEKTDTLARKSEKREIVLDYMETVEEDKVKVIKKIFGEHYNQLVSNVELTKEEKYIFNDLRVKIRKYIERILAIRNGEDVRSFAADRVILAKDNGFKEKLNEYFEKKRYPLAMNIFKHYLSINEEVKNYFSKFYDLNTFALKTNVYSSKNDVKSFKTSVNEIKDYIKVCSSISNAFREKLVNYFKKPFMSDARVQLVYEIALEGINTLSDEEKLLLQKLYGEDYKELNIYADIKAEDIDTINKSIDKIGNYVSHSLEIMNTYKATIFNYFHKSGMAVSYKEKLDAEITKFIDDSQSKGKYVAVMLYGGSYAKLNHSVNLSQEQVKLFNSLLDDIDKHLKAVESTLKHTRKQARKMSTSFLDYFKDSNISEEQNNIIIESVKETIKNDDSKYKDLFLKYFDSNYNLIPGLEMSKEDKMNIRYFRKQIYIKVFGMELPKSIYDLAAKGHISDARKVKIYAETDKFITVVDENTQNILKKLYGFNYRSIKSDVKLTSYELYIINKFNIQLNDYISTIVPLAKAKKPTKVDYVQTKNGKLPKKFLSFIGDISTNMTLEELTKDVVEFINKSKSKNVANVKKLYGEELGEFNESIEPTEEEILSVRFLIRDIKNRYRLIMKNTDPRDVEATLKLPESVLDIFNVTDPNKTMIINRINFNISMRDSAFSRILHDNYGVDLTGLKSAYVKVTANDVALYRQSVKAINNFLSKDLVDYNLKTDLLEYFYTDTSNRKELIDGLLARLDTLNNPQGNRFKRLIKFMYDDDFKLVKPMPLKECEVVAFDKVIKVLTKPVPQKKEKLTSTNPKIRREFKSIFLDNFLFEGEEVVPESRKNTIVKIVRGSKAQAAKLALELFGNNLDQECKDIELYNENKTIMNTLIRAITKRVTKTYSRGLFMLADNFIEQFFIETDTDEIKDAIKKYLIKYMSSSKSKYKNIVSEAYDKDYNLKKDYTFDGDKRSYYAFVYSIKLAVERYRKKIINGKTKKVKPKEEKITKVRKAKQPKQPRQPRQPRQPKLDMMDLGKNGYLALTNDLFDIQLIGNEEIKLPEFELTDDIINNAYNELMDSETIMDLLMISRDTLTEFYINHIDDLEDPTEAFNYLINLGEKDVIKRLMVSPLFLRVVNYLTDIERQVIYLKLVQVSNKSLTDERIAEITKVDINTIQDYEIMTKDEKVNSLNDFIIKRKY